MRRMRDDPVLAFDRVHKRYGVKRVLDDATFTISAGVVVGLVGANGAGKTTLMRIAAGLQPPDTGVVSIRQGGYFGGFETLPVGGTVNDLRRGLGLETCDTGSVRLSTLSRGELQTVGLAAAFELSCDVLLLDEPWTGLEPDRRDALSARIAAYARAGRTVVCSSHELDEVARVAHEVLFIGGGQLRRYEAHETGFQREELLRIYRDISASERASRV